MAYTVGIIHPRPETVSNIFHQVSEQVQRLFTAYIHHRKMMRAETELRGLSDQALSDIGVSRSEIYNVVRTGRRSF